MTVKRLPLVLAIVLLSLAMTSQGHALMISASATNMNTQSMLSRAMARMNARRHRTSLQATRMPFFPTMPGFTKPKPTVTTPISSSSSSSSKSSSSSSSVSSTSSVAATVDGVRRQILDLTNAERAKAGLPALTYNTKLQQSAQGHAEDMKARNFFDHTNPDGKTPTDRIKATGYLDIAGCNCRWSYADGENIAMGQKTAEQVMKDWMNSPGHKANILSANFAEIGVGYVGGDKPYWVQNFGRLTKGQ